MPVMSAVFCDIAVLDYLGPEGPVDHLNACGADQKTWFGVPNRRNPDLGPESGSPRRTKKQRPERQEDSRSEKLGSRRGGGRLGFVHDWDLFAAQVLSGWAFSCEGEYNGNFATSANPVLLRHSGRISRVFTSHEFLTGFTIQSSGS